MKPFGLLSNPSRLSGCILALCLVVANISDADELDRSAAIRTLGLSALPGDPATYYSANAELRATSLQTLLGGELAYFADQFHAQLAPITMAVLDPHDWPSVAGDEPFGMPSVSAAKPYVFVMPTDWNQVTWMDFPRREDLPPGIVKRLLQNGKTWNEVKFEGGDGIGTHEIGHTIVYELGIDAQKHWFNELLASYVGYAYLKARHPHHALSSEAFWNYELGHTPHPFTSLKDFETRYLELQEKYPGNYGWYQVALDQRVMEVYQHSGIDFLRQVRMRFPKGSRKLSTIELLNTLEAMNPGWITWSKHLERGQVSAVEFSRD